MGRKQTLSFAFLAISLVSAGESINLTCEKAPFGTQEIESRIWDASHLSTLDDYCRGYVSIEPSGFITEYTGVDAEHYLLSDNALVFRGYTRGNSTGALADSTVAVCRFPPVAGETAAAPYNVTGYIGGSPAYHENGSIETSVLASGRFVFAPGDTATAILIKELRTCITTGRNDSTGVKNEDCILRWYAPGARIPFAIQMKRAEDKAFRLFLSESIPSCVNQEEIYTDDDRRSAIIAGAEVSRRGTDIAVALGQLPGVRAEVYIIDVSGNIYGRTSHRLDAARNEFVIGTAGIPGGAPMLVITIDGEPPLTEKRMLQI